MFAVEDMVCGGFVRVFEYHDPDITNRRSARSRTKNCDVNPFRVEHAVETILVASRDDFQ